jgi:hypothetical protein
MENPRYKRRNVLLTFIIGFVAGTAPFVFMKLLPMMLHPELYAAELRQVTIMLAGVLLTGCVIGVITSLMFAGEFDKKDPKEIFVYALGIPAILISTVSGLMTDFNATQKISTIQASASAALLSSTPSPQSIPEVKTSPVDQSPSVGQTQSLLLGSAWAEDLSLPQTAADGTQQFIVVIGTYTNEQEAKDFFNKFQQRRFKTEVYVSKRLQLRRVDGRSPQYIIIYNGFDNQAEAQRTYDLLHINDPDLNVSLMRASPQ